MEAPCIRRCRLCACEEGTNDFSDIFEDNPEMELEMKISKLLPVVVMPWDPMSHCICSGCIGKLNSFNEFYDVTLKADRFLRTFYPSVPESEVENVDPIVQVLDKKALKMPPTNFQKSLTSPSENFSSIGPDGSDSGLPNKPMDSFIVNPITSTDSVFTCQDCFRTFTKQSTALTHTCARIEECGELEGMSSAEGNVSAMKIQFFYVSSGKFICCLCRRPFKSRSQVSHHLKRHFMGKKWREVLKKPAKHRKGAINLKQKSGIKCLSAKPGNGIENLNCDQTTRFDITASMSSDMNLSHVTNQPENKETEKLTDPITRKEETLNGITVIVLEDDEEGEGESETGMNTTRIDDTTDQLLVNPQSGEVELHSEDHQEMKGEEGSFACSFCKMMFKDEDALTVHERCHCIDLTEIG